MDIRGLVALNKASKLTQLGLICDRSTNYTSLSDGSVITRTGRYRHHILVDKTFNIRFIFGNFYMNQGIAYIETDGANAISVKASLEFGGVLYPVRFSGTRTVSISVGGYMISDPVPINLVKGDIIYSRTYVSVGTGEKYPRGQLTNGFQNDGGEGINISDLTDSGVAGDFTGYSSAYHPYAIIGEVWDKKGVMLIGDSIMRGSYDNGESGSESGFIRRVLNNVAPFWMCASDGERAQHFATGLNSLRRMDIAKYVKSAIIHTGINDASAGRTLAQYQADITAIGNWLVARGVKAYLCTIAPMTTSTDNWATVENQTLALANEAIFRVPANTWIRTCPAPFSEIFDTASTVEEGTTGKFKANISYDGTHPKAAGHILMAAAINISALL